MLRDFNGVIIPNTKTPERVNSSGRPLFNREMQILPYAYSWFSSSMMRMTALPRACTLR
jgi:hypothetical protein